MNGEYIRAMFEGMSTQWQRDRAETQMTLGALVSRLQELNPETIIQLGSPHSYRGYYCDLAFQLEPVTVKEALDLCRNSMGEIFEGYKGGDFMMGKNTPVWSAPYGHTGLRIMAVNEDGTLELAPEDEE